MPDLSTAQALNLFEICQTVAARVRVDDEDDRHDFALKTFENFFAEDRGEVTKERMWAYAQASISGLIKNKHRRESRMVRESMCIHEDGESYFELYLPTVGANQEISCDANFWRGCIADLPEWHRDVLSEFADGGTILSFCNSRDLLPNDVMKTAKHAREQLREIGAQRQLERARWPDGVRCAHCEADDAEWVRQERRYRCFSCGNHFTVIAKSGISRFGLPWSGSRLVRFSTPCLKVCQAVEIIRDGGGAEKIGEAFDVPYLTAFELVNGIRETDWVAPLAGLKVMPAKIREPVPHGKGPKRWSEAEASTLRQMTEGGHSAAEIAKKVGRSVGSVSQKMLNLKHKLGIASRRTQPQHEVTKIGPWEDEEIAFLKTAWAADYTATEIATELGRSRNSVLGKIHRHRLIRIEAA